MTNEMSSNSQSFDIVNPMSWNNQDHGPLQWKFDLDTSYHTISYEPKGATTVSCSATRPFEPTSESGEEINALKLGVNS